MVHQSSLISAVLVPGAYATLHLFFFIYDMLQKRNKIRKPTEFRVTNGPGQSLLKEIKIIGAKLQRVFQLMLFLPIAIYVAHLSYSHFGQVAESWIRTAISTGGCLIIMFFYLIKLFRYRTLRHRLKQAYDGEVIVAQGLNQMMVYGYQVYHDFPGEGFNIDHILVGPTGVMAVETQTLSSNKSKLGNSKTNAVVTYDGRMLHFPKFSDHQSIDNAKRNAAWLSEWLSTAIGEEVCARAMVALPGWFVKRTSADGIPVVNPEQFETLFKHIKPRPLTEEMIDLIALQVEKHCGQSCTYDDDEQVFA